ncbi:ORF26 [Fowl aviadenovirus A]|uniref:ORF26 n=1 Tax=Fowl aviadenovirus A TaxID=190061 RepID=UPI00001D9784|nr:ORF26 [Fowl aviadenovirus A]
MLPPIGCDRLPEFDVVCPRDWIGFQSKCYYFSESESNWSEAEKFCRQQEAELAVRRSEEEKEFLLRQCGTGTNWLGVTRKSKDGADWVDASYDDYVPWYEIRGGGDCVYLNGDRVTSAYCDTQKLFVCSCQDSYSYWLENK